MVRLKAGIFNADNSVYLFQFLHGAIKSLKLNLNLSKVDSFQFLHGAIKSSITRQVVVDIARISIPTWCD